VKWKLEIEMKLSEKNGIRIEIEFFQNGNNPRVQCTVTIIN